MVIDFLEFGFTFRFPGDLLMSSAGPVGWSFVKTAHRIPSASAF
jgi:hypothetical protein